MVTTLIKSTRAMPLFTWSSSLMTTNFTGTYTYQRKKRNELVPQRRNETTACSTGEKQAQYEVANSSLTS